MIKRIDSSKLFSEIVLSNGTAYFSGQVAITNKGEAFQKQTHEVLDRIDVLLAKIGSEKSKILSALVHITSRKHLGEFNRIWASWVPEGQSPARTTVITELVNDDFDVEITIIAECKMSNT